MLQNTTDILYQKWKMGFLELEEEIDIFEAKFNQIKECECEIEDCLHFKNIVAFDLARTLCNLRIWICKFR